MPWSRLLPIAVLACLVASGARAESWPLAPPVLAPAEGSQHDPSIAAGGDGFLAAWVDLRTPPDTELRLARIDAAGMTLDPVGIPVFDESVPYGNAIQQPKVVWTGRRWIVVFGARSSLMAVLVAPDGTIEKRARTIASGNDAPFQQFHVVFGRGRVFVGGQSPNGASFLMLDGEANVVVPPKTVDVRSGSHWIVSVFAAHRQGEFLLVDAATTACTGCAKLTSHRIATDGRRLESASIADLPDGTSRQFAMAETAEGYAVVSQNYERGTVEVRLLTSRGHSFGPAHVIVPPTSKGGFGTISLASDGERVDAVFFFHEPSERLGAYRLAIEGSSVGSPEPLPLPEATAASLAIVRGDAGVAVIVAGTSPPGPGGDLLLRLAPSIEAIPDATPHVVAFSARTHWEGRATRNGSETLATWVEGRVYFGDGAVVGRRLDSGGRPLGGAPVELLDDVSYAIASDGNGYLVAANFGTTLKARRLRSDLTWLDAEWTPISQSACGYLVDGSVSWDGGGFWIPWTSCGSYNPVLRRFDRELRPLTPPVEFATPDGSTTIKTIPMGGSVIAVWTGLDPGCMVCTCPPPVVPLSAARVNHAGLELNAPELLGTDVESLAFDVAASRDEVFVLWTSWNGLSATRLTDEFVNRDVVTDQYGRHGTMLDDSGTVAIDVGWDGSAWIVVALGYRYYYGWPGASLGLRRFKAGADLKAAWLEGERRELPAVYPGIPVVLAAAPGASTLLFEPVRNEETTGVLRYYIRNLGAPPRLRGVRR